MVDVFDDYLAGSLTEKNIRKQAVLIYQVSVDTYRHSPRWLTHHPLQLMEEMNDNGFPLTTESNVLQAMIMKPTILNKASQLMGRKKKWVDNGKATHAPPPLTLGIGLRTSYQPASSPPRTGVAPTSATHPTVRQPQPCPCPLPLLTLCRGVCGH